MNVTTTTQSQVAEFLNVAKELVLEVREWASVLWVKVQGMRPRFVSKKVVNQVSITLEKAQEIVKDPEAIKRGYVSEEIISDAESLAKDIVNQSWFKKGMEVGTPHQFFVQSSVYCQMDEKYPHNRKFASVCEIASYLLAA